MAEGSLHAHSVLVNSYWHCHLFRWGPDPAKLVNTMWAVVEAMQRIDALDYRTLTYSGVVRIVRGELQRGVADLRRALEVNPNVTVTLMWLSWAEVAAGLGKEAEEHALLAIRISPRDHRITNSYVVLAMVSYSACKFTEAAQWAAMAIQSRPATVIARAIMIACNARAGDLSEAARERAALVEFAPDFICSLFRGESPIFKRPEDLDRLLDGLRLAGCGERCQ
jgi:adenylate cyclase